MWPPVLIGYGWNVTRVSDANDLEMLETRAAGVQEHQRPADPDHRGQPHRLRRRRTNQDTSGAHGEPAGRDEVAPGQEGLRLARGRQIPGFPRGVREHFGAGMWRARARVARRLDGRFEEYKAEYADLADQLDRMLHRQLPEGWDQDLPTSRPTRKVWPRAIRQAGC